MTLPIEYYNDILTCIILLKTLKGLLIYLYNKETDENDKKDILEMINTIEDLAYRIANKLEGETNGAPTHQFYI